MTTEPTPMREPFEALARAAGAYAELAVDPLAGVAAPVPLSLPPVVERSEPTKAPARRRRGKASA